MMRLCLLLITGCLICSFSLLAQTPIENQIYLWNGTPPGSDSVSIVETIEDRDPSGGPCFLNRVVQHVTEPSIKAFVPDNPNGTAVLICPGGGYSKLAYDKEGYEIATWFNKMDITAFVLKYRLPVDGHQNRELVALQDAQRALKYIRDQAAAFALAPDKVGIMGGSAGGHLAASASVHHTWQTYPAESDWDSLSARPDFSILMYPVISFQDSIAHNGSRLNLLGAGYSNGKKDSFSCELHIDSTTPPAFIFHSLQDGSVSFKNSKVYAEGLVDAGIEHKLSLYSSGGHGIGKCEAGQTQFSKWPYDLEKWLVNQSLTAPCQGNIPTITMVISDSTRLSCTPATSYQWFLNGVLIPGATDSIYTPNVIGTYKVATSGLRAGSGSDCLLFSEELDVDVVVGQQLIEKNKKLQIFPNPAQDALFWKGNQLPEASAKYLIIDSSGVITQQGFHFQQSAINRIAIPGLRPGIFTLVLYTNHFSMAGTFVKK